MAHSRYHEPMETLTVVIALALSVELILHKRLHGIVGNLSSRLHHAEVSIARMKTDNMALRSAVTQQDEEHRVLREELEAVKE